MQVMPYVDILFGNETVSMTASSDRITASGVTMHQTSDLLNSNAWMQNLETIVVGIVSIVSFPGKIKMFATSYGIYSSIQKNI